MTPRNLVRDTTYWKLRSAAARAVHGTDDALWRACRRHVRILVEATSPLSLAVCRPVLDALVDDPQIQCWFTSSDRIWTSERIFDATGLAERVVTPDRARWMKFDAYINTDFWNMTWLQRRARRVHLFHGVAGKYGLDAPLGIAPVVASFDRLMFANRDRLRRYVEAGLVDPESGRAALVGYPKVDCLVDGSLDRAAIERDLGLDPARPTVLYAPTWSPHSSLQTMGREIVAALAGLDVNVVVKLHDRSLDSSERGSGRSDWRRYFEETYAPGAIHLAAGADASPYLFAADLLVTDHSSVAFEFMLLDRPLLVVDCPALVVHGRINPQKVALLRTAARVVTTARAVPDAVVGGLATPEARSAERRAIAAELFYEPGTATGRAVRVLYDVLELEAPRRAACTTTWTDSCSATDRTGI